MGLEPTASGATILRSSQLSYTHRVKMVRLRGFEPLTYGLEVRCSIQTELQAHSFLWSGKRGSNPRPSAWKADALAN